MTKFRRFLSGELVYNMASRLLEECTERLLEPYYRRKAWRKGFGAGYEAWLIVLRQNGEYSGSVRAFKLAEQRKYPQL